MTFDPNMICSACGKQLNEKDGVCPYCGQAIHIRPAQGQPSYGEDASPQQDSSVSTPVIKSEPVAQPPEQQCKQPVRFKRKPSARMWLFLAVCVVVAVFVFSGNRKQTVAPADSENFIGSKIITTNTTTQPFYLDFSPDIDAGRVTVSWTDDTGSAPYTVSYQLATGFSVDTPFYWAGGTESASTTNSKSFTINDLAPGKRYKIQVTDCNKRTADTIYSIPSADKFSDGNLSASSFKTTITPMYKAASESDEDAKSCSSLNSATIQNDMGSIDYGFRYQINYPDLSYDREYFVQVFITSPDGYTECEIYRTVEFGKDYSATVYALLGNWTFSKYYQLNKNIPSGEWTVALYLDGQLANENTFNVV